MGVLWLRVQVMRHAAPVESASLPDSPYNCSQTTNVGGCSPTHLTSEL